MATSFIVVARLPLQSLRQKFQGLLLKSSGKRFKITTKLVKETPKNETSDSVGKRQAHILLKVPVWKRLGPLSSAIGIYAQCQGKRPYLTQFVTSLVIYFIGDLSAQKINGGPYDPYLMIRTLIISAGSSIPTYEWLIFLGNHFNYHSKFLSLIIKILVNQVIFSPINNVWFFGMHSILSGGSLPDVWQRLNDTVPRSLLNSCKLWPPITAFSLVFVEPQYRFVFTGVIAIGWQTYLSFLNKKSELKKLT